MMGAKYLAHIFHSKERIEYLENYGYQSKLDLYDWIKNKQYEFGIIIHNEVKGTILSEFLITNNYFLQLIEFLRKYKIPKENKIKYLNIISLGYKKNELPFKNNKFLMPYNDLCLTNLIFNMSLIHSGKKKEAYSCLIPL